MVAAMTIEKIVHFPEKETENGSVDVTFISIGSGKFSVYLIFFCHLTLSILKVFSVFRQVPRRST